MRDFEINDKYVEEFEAMVENNPKLKEFFVWLGDKLAEPYVPVTDHSIGCSRFNIPRAAFEWADEIVQDEQTLKISNLAHACGYVSGWYHHKYDKAEEEPTLDDLIAYPL